MWSHFSGLWPRKVRPLRVVCPPFTNRSPADASLSADHRRRDHHALSRPARGLHSGHLGARTSCQRRASDSRAGAAHGDAAGHPARPVQQPAPARHRRQRPGCRSRRDRQRPVPDRRARRVLDPHRPRPQRPDQGQQGQPADVPGARLQPGDRPRAGVGKDPARRAGDPADHAARQARHRPAEPAWPRRDPVHLRRVHPARLQPERCRHRGSRPRARRDVLAGRGVRAVAAARVGRPVACWRGTCRRGSTSPAPATR